MTRANRGQRADFVETVDKNCEFLRRKSQWFLKQVQSTRAAAAEISLQGLDESIVAVKLEQLEKLQSQFEDNQTQLEQICVDEVDSDARVKFMETFIMAKASMAKCLSSQTIQESHTSTRIEHSAAPSMTAARTRLPALQLPVFSGIVTDWPDFWSLFQVIVDKEQTLSSIEKFQHLRASLSGTALDVVRSLEICHENYAKAVTLLKRRFDIKSIQFQAHISQLFGLKTMAENSAADLRGICDKSSSHLRALCTIATKDEILDGFLIHLIGKKADGATQAKWEEELPEHGLPSWESMATFFERRARMLENVELALATRTSGNQVNSKKLSARNSFVATSSTKRCVFCQAEHAISSCPLFLNLSPSLRLKETKRLKLCINCLSKGHFVKDCKSSFCKSCSAKHHSLLHLNQQFPERIESSGTPEAKSALVVDSKPATLLSSNHALNTVTILATAMVMVKGRNGILFPCRALLDSASQLNCVTARLANRLQVKRTKSATIISGFGQTDIVAKENITIALQSADEKYSTFFSAVIVPTITSNQPEANLSSVQWNIPANITLADPGFYHSQGIDMLIGASLFFDLLCVGQLQLDPSLPILQKTKLGWIVSGNVSFPVKQVSCCAVTHDDSFDHDSDCALHELVKRFWEVEGHTQLSIKRSKEDIDCEKHFVSSVRRLDTGEYAVRLPAKVDLSALGDSYARAVYRLKALERKFAKQPQLKQQYAAFIKEYRDLRHMTLISSVPPGVVSYFLPHHCVLKADSTTTKLRVVFDASAQTSTGYSLNDMLMAGPAIQPKLVETLLRFRSHRIAITADICKMYRCVRMERPDSFLQCIVWREHPDDALQIYRLDTVTYGTKPAAFLAIRAMRQAAMDEAHDFPLGAKIVLRDFYVDDLISGGSTEDEVLEIISQTKAVLSRGKFVLRKWCSNNERVLQEVDESSRERAIAFSDGSDCTKTLGLIWDPKEDNFLFSLTSMAVADRVTRRQVLAAVARIYDPLGLIGPVILKVKVFLQSLWKQRLAWDESVPQSLHSSWHQLCTELSSVSSIQFPRFVGLDCSDLQIHGFCDASIKAYGACVYVRATKDDCVQVNLLCSKSRVAPLKTLTVPKLELCAAMLLAELMKSISDLQAFSGDSFCWSDSTIVLSWLEDVAANYNIFVANRISSIQEMSHGMSWRHVPTEHNPADILSKGALPKELEESALWKHGPAFLQEDEYRWPKSDKIGPSALERKRNVLSVTSSIADYSIRCKFINSFRSTQRVYAYVYRFIKSKSHQWSSAKLTVEEIEAGTNILIRMVQRSAMHHDYSELEAKGTIGRSSKIASLNPFIDKTGVLRVGGRLENANLTFNEKHPIILPADHSVTKSIIVDFHQRLLHAGPQALLTSIRLKFWPLGGLKSIAKVVNRCIRCFRTKPALIQHIMGNLPAERVRPQPPFYTTGVDFGGPYFYKSEVRNRQPIKCYICLFVCFVTKAVHLELVKDLATSSFLAALKRFASLRGRPRVIWSDNATNFVGAKNELKELRELMLNEEHQSEVHQHCLNEGINWRFIPPRSPHFGGLWEASIKLAKHHLRRSIGRSVLNFEELRTLVYQIAAIINSRPLFQLTERPDDLQVLTPGHFLTGGMLTGVAEPDLSSLNPNRLRHWQVVCQIQQSFWKAWSTAYLTLLQERAKWRLKSANIPEGALVLLKDDNLPPMKWQIGRVVECIKGNDGVARVANVRTSTGISKRAVAKMCLLPIDDVESRSPSTGGGC